jgi:hypothetical protein
MELCGQRDHEAARTSGGAGLKKADKGRGSLSSLVALLSLNNHLSAASGMQAADASVAGKSSHNVEPRNERCGSETAAPPWRRLWTSAVAAGLAEVLTMPLDFAKVRLMLQNISASEPSGVHYKGMTDCIARTVRAEGPATLFKGTGPALARQCGYTGLSFLLYEPILNGIATPGARALVCPLFVLSAVRAPSQRDCHSACARCCLPRVCPRGNRTPVVLRFFL